MDKNVLPKGATSFPAPPPTKTEKTAEQIEADELRKALPKYHKIILASGISVIISVIGIVIGMMLHIPLLVYIFIPIFIVSLVIESIFSFKYDKATKRIGEIGWKMITDFLIKMATGEEITRK